MTITELRDKVNNHRHEVGYDVAKERIADYIKAFRERGDCSQAVDVEALAMACYMQGGSDFMSVFNLK